MAAPLPFSDNATVQMKPALSFFKLEDFRPSLRQAVKEQPVDLSKVLRVAVQVEKPLSGRPPVPAAIDRRRILFGDGEKFCAWEADPLEAMFRGNKQPPVLGDYPEAYNDTFALLDLHALEISKLFGDRRDEEMLEIYAYLRRRPDGKSLGFVHDFMWQAAALILGSRPLSQAEFEAIMSRLERFLPHLPHGTEFAELYQRLAYDHRPGGHAAAGRMVSEASSIPSGPPGGRSCGPPPSLRDARAGGSGGG